MVKKWLEDGQFSCTFLSGFRLISRQRLDRFAWNLVRSETGSIQRRRKSPDVKILSQSGDIKPRKAKNRPKIDQNLWMIQKIFGKIFLAQMLPNGPIRKVITLKVKFEDLRLHLPLWRHGSRLRKFFDRKFFDQKKFFFKVSKWFNSQSYQVKIEIWKNFPFSAHYEGILARHLENSSKSNKWNMSNKMNKLNKMDSLDKSRC